MLDEQPAEQPADPEQPAEELATIASTIPIVLNSTDSPSIASTITTPVDSTDITSIDSASIDPTIPTPVNSTCVASKKPAEQPARQLADGGSGSDGLPKGPKSARAPKRSSRQRSKADVAHDAPPPNDMD
mmetsp:Transcript_9273/g.20227  ORF Transcript_9273/g.20227 Transcript_9273/m.20227 type:complete len:130 (-) Transcript_9273:528-917(-)